MPLVSSSTFVAYIGPSAIFSYHLARHVSTEERTVRGMLLIQTSSFALDKVLRKEEFLKKQIDDKIGYQGRSLPQCHLLNPQTYSQKGFQMIRRHSSPACPSNLGMSRRLKRSSFPRSGNTMFHSKVYKLAASAFGCKKH